MVAVTKLLGFKCLNAKNSVLKVLSKKTMLSDKNSNFKNFVSNPIFFKSFENLKA